jgi:hypothetical protein
VSVNSPDAPVYLNVILSTDSIDPSWGTIVLAAAVGAAPIVGNAKPMVGMDATVDQAAEGGSPGEFTFYRYSSDTSQALTVNYSVGGSATAGTDYTALSGSVTIPAGSSFATVDVSALADAVVGEGVENVTVSITPDANLYYVNPTSSQDTVQVLNKAKYLVAFYGAGSTMGFGNQWFAAIANRATTDHQYDHLILRQQDQGGLGLDDLFAYLNANGDNVISRAEAESADIRALGYSWGGIQAINFTWHLNRKGKRIRGYKLEEVIDVQKLVTIDPVNNKQPFKKARDLQSNVKSFKSYYQRKGGRSTIRRVDPVTNQVMAQGDDLSNWFSRGIKGSQFTAGDRQVEVVHANDPVTRLHTFSTPLITANGRMYGNDVNHDTMPWYLYDNVIADLQ